MNMIDLLLKRVSLFQNHNLLKVNNKQSTNKQLSLDEIKKRRKMIMIF